SEYAIRAFESYALDYLLKPFADGRFSTAVERARSQIAARRAREAESGPNADARLASLVSHFGRTNPPAYHETIAIRTGSQYDIIRVADIDWIEADGNYSRLHVQQRPRILTKTLAVLEREVLDPSVFLRVHRSAIVNCTKIIAADAQANGQLTLALQGGSQVQCSRRFRRVVEQRLHFTT
ncbi:MAG: LytTR family DNA-binding domain-containing protein, partial [bacterium]